jgi:8-oxo-dGTP pyrophosphatase MutT (NUDIX family)
MEPGETPADAVMREAWEEMGLRVDPVRIAGGYGGAEFRVRYADGDETEYVMIVFECAVAPGASARGDETPEARFWSRGDARGLDLSGWLRTVLETFFARPSGAHFHPPRWRPPDFTSVA